MGDNEHERRDTPREGHPLDVELTTVANLSISFGAITRDLGRAVRDLREMEGAERRAEFYRLGRELGEVGDLCHEARIVFWDCAGQLPSDAGEVVARAAAPPSWWQRHAGVLIGCLVGIVVGVAIVLLMHK